MWRVQVACLFWEMTGRSGVVSWLKATTLETLDGCGLTGTGETFVSVCLCVCACMCVEVRGQY